MKSRNFIQKADSENHGACEYRKVDHRALKGEAMMEGILTINLDPPYISLESEGTQSQRTFSLDQIRSILEELGVQRWPLRDCLIRLQGEFSFESLQRIGLVA
jgi:hypothetical protein